MDDVHRVLVVDDEPAILRAVSRALAARRTPARRHST
jgi:CheY-like chemotaxis protein